MEPITFATAFIVTILPGMVYGVAKAYYGQTSRGMLFWQMLTYFSLVFAPTAYRFAVEDGIVALPWMTSAWLGWVLGAHIGWQLLHWWRRETADCD